MSLMPGIVGQKTELTDGVKVDTIDELTSGNGVKIKGKTSGIVTIPAGYIGEEIISTYNAFSVAGDSDYHAITGGLITLTTGIWDVSFTHYVQAASGRNLDIIRLSVNITNQQPTYTCRWGTSGQYQATHDVGGGYYGMITSTPGRFLVTSGTFTLQMYDWSGTLTGTANVYGTIRGVRIA